MSIATVPAANPSSIILVIHAILYDHEIQFHQLISKLVIVMYVNSEQSMHQLIKGFASLGSNVYSQQTHNVAGTSLKRCCNVTTLQRRCNDVVATLCVCWVWTATSGNQHCAPSKDTDQPAHTRSLIRTFTGRIWNNQGWKVSSCGQRRLWSDSEDPLADLSLHRSHHKLKCTFSDVATHFICKVCSQLTYWLFYTHLNCI